MVLFHLRKVSVSIPDVLGDVDLWCCSPIMSITPMYKGKVVLKLGIFPQIPQPEWESFSVNRQKWESPLEGAIQYKKVTGGEKME